MPQKDWKSYIEEFSKLVVTISTASLGALGVFAKDIFGPAFVDDYLFLFIAMLVLVVASLLLSLVVFAELVNHSRSNPNERKLIAAANLSYICLLFFFGLFAVSSYISQSLGDAAEPAYSEIRAVALGYIATSDEYRDRHWRLSAIVRRDGGKSHEVLLVDDREQVLPVKVQTVRGGLLASVRY